MVLTNPSRSSFASYLHQSDTGGVGRDFNGFIFSVYSKNRSQGTGRFSSDGFEIRKEYKEFYIGTLGNFIKTPTL